MLTINSGSTPSTQQSQAGTLFGTASQTQKPPLFSLGSTSTPAQPPSNLFGSTSTNSQPQGGSIFGLGTQQTTSAAPASSLFGSTASTQPQQISGLFGSTTSTQPQQTGSLFGGTLGQSQQKTGSSLFGSLGQQQSTSTSTPSLFGASTAQQKPSLFGGSLLSQPQQQTSSLFGTSTQPQQQQVVPGVKIDLSNIKPTTRFSELHEDLQSVIAQLDTFIHQQIKWCHEIQESLPKRGADIHTIPGDVEYLTQRVEAVELALDKDVRDIKRVKEEVKADQNDARRCFNAIENLKLPSQFHYTGLAGAAAVAAGVRGVDESGDAEDLGARTSDLISYFQNKTNELDERLSKYQGQLSEIEAHLTTVEASAVEQIEKLVLRRGRGDDGKEGLRELVAALRGFEEAVLRVASRVGEVRENVVEVTLGGGGKNLGRFGR